MRRLWIGLGILAVVAGVGYALFDHYKYHIPGIISRWRDPIAPNHPITWSPGPATVAAASKRPPNIIVILADDMGYNDISLFGGGVGGGAVPTPNIDSIGRQGASFDTGYAANATCSPSRAAIMTGRYPTRFGFEFTAVPVVFARAVSRGEHAAAQDRPAGIFHEERTKGLIDYPDMGVPHSEITIADLLRSNGYHTMQIGKWHLGEAKPLQPNGQGFDEALGFLAGGGMFMPQDDPGVVNAKLPWDPIDRFLWPNLPYAVQWNGGQRFAPKGHLTDYWTDNAVAAIKANRNRPFFLYLAYNAPHTPLQATKADYDALPQIKDHTTRVYGAMIRQLDRGVGRVLQTLKDQGIDDNTLVIFTSDNGGAWYTGLAESNAPFRGYKATYFEGGLRVPFLLRWPGRITPGTRVPGPAHHLDIFATAAAAAGVPMPADRPMDGVSLLASVAAGTGATAAATRVPHDRLFWRSGDNKVVRDGAWKLQIAAKPNAAWLYDLSTDPTERRNLAAAQPARVTAMRAMIAAHDRDAARKPLWPALIEAPIRIDVPLNTPWKRGQEYVYWSN
ncbi:MAG: sulfatase-like hydrolase/transferase [Sphingomonas sp.]|uniref:sulfatase-like hydrolase/transferase n=1 Tax=Sphingomonas sp. TaxID=28214 RepID=UPI000DB341E0|nr:sulfatase-like hydrolase/transferase [Sphingomonas sp.]PZP19193.1 MAG: sulfatase [Sphingomonas hengshuiensis]